MSEATPTLPQPADRGLPSRAEGAAVPELLIERADVHFFWSVFEPLDLASNSIDPQGFMAGYISLADRLLPGFVTITADPRYTSMLCYAVRRAHEAVGTDSGSLASRRRQMIETIKCVERAWTPACGVAERAAGDAAVDGVRGVRAVHR